MQQMQFTPVTVLDNFFDDPDKIRNWALGLDYTPDPEGRWPGIRSKALHELNSVLFQTICNKFFRLFFDPSKERVSWSVDMRFQLINNKYGSGWVHTDQHNSKITGLIYLSPNLTLSGGTSIYQEKKTVIAQEAAKEYCAIKENYYKNMLNFDIMEKNRQKHNAQYEETIRVSNVYNRLVSFDSHLFHAAQDFFGTEEDSRLTLVFFVRELYADKTPLDKFRRYSFET